MIIARLDKPDNFAHLAAIYGSMWLINMKTPLFGGQMDMIYAEGTRR